MLSGCLEEEVVSLEIKRPEEPLYRSDWEKFERIVNDLPEPKLRELPSFFPPLPNWQLARTLPVNELAAEERRRIEAAWDTKQQHLDLSSLHQLSRLLRREQLTEDQFHGLIFTIGTAMRRANVVDEGLFQRNRERGNRVAQQLEHDHRLFASLSLEDQYRILDDAIWLHRIERSRRFLEIPESNIKFVQRHAKWLKEVMPAEFLLDPFADLGIPLDELGVPFVEGGPSGSDEQLEWNTSDAIVGY
ncbi:hypothetical protein GC163_20065 [bacterium]|nr:hypothetical protein [bacterium]